MSEPTRNGGQAAGIINAVKSLNLTNVLVIALLLLALGPAYLAWKIVNDEQLLTIFLSSFEERSLEGTDCALRIVSARGGGPGYNVSKSYAFSGADRWYIAVHLVAEPTAETAKIYCDTLDGIINYIRGTGPNPKYPFTDRDVFPHPGLPSRDDRKDPP